MIWNKLAHFKKEDFNYPDKMSWATLFVLDNLREKLKVPITVTSDFRPDSTTFHNKVGCGIAIDFYPIWTVDQSDGAILIDNELMGMNLIYGLGAYPCTNNKVYHLDLRSDRLYWYQDKEGTYRYYSDVISLSKKLKEIGGN